MKTTSNNAKLIFACSLAIVAILIVQGALNATPPAQLQVTMYRLNSSGSIYQPGGTKYPCPDSQNSWGCTAFDSDQTLGHAVTVVSYPYGNTPEPMVSLETGYLKNVVPGEMSIDIAPSSALEAQVIAARSYGWNKSGDLNNSAQRQVYVPYRFEFLRVEGGDTAHNPATTPTPNVSHCASITPTGDTRYQRTVCDALDATSGRYLTAHDVATPAFAEYSLDAHLTTASGSESYLQSVADPISYDSAIPTIVANSGAHGRGMSQNGAMRWGHGNASRASTGDAWSVTWNFPEQILTHYYTGIDLRDGNDTVITPPLRWNPLQHDIPATLTRGGDGAFVTLALQNTGTAAWSNGAYGIYYAWCEVSDTTCPDSTTSEDWWMNDAIYSSNPNATQIEPGETVAAVYVYLWADEALSTGTKRLVLDVCAYQGPLRRQAPHETIPNPQQARRNQKNYHPQQPSTEWACFKNQNPNGLPYETLITIE